MDPGKFSFEIMESFQEEAPKPSAPSAQKQLLIGAAIAVPLLSIMAIVLTIAIARGKTKGPEPKETPKEVRQEPPKKPPPGPPDVPTMRTETVVVGYLNEPPPMTEGEYFEKFRQPPKQFLFVVPHRRFYAYFSGQRMYWDPVADRWCNGDPK
jgi:hypothetical protein